MKLSTPPTKEEFQALPTGVIRQWLKRFNVEYDKGIHRPEVLAHALQTMPKGTDAERQSYERLMEVLQELAQGK